MCAVCGFAYQDRNRPADYETLAAMLASMDYRGPDDEGIYHAPGIGLGSRRLAIMDLSERGHMPMSSPDRRFWIVHNGEVYNFRELRKELEAKGHHFRSDSDTEVILKGYIEEGPEILSKLDGMFAFAVWDCRERRLFIARDHAGIKPLYYYESDGDFYFASEQKALFRAGIPAQLGDSVWPELLAFGYTAGERTVYRGIKRLLAGHYLIWENGRTTITRWWNLGEQARALKGLCPADPGAWFREALDRSVDYRRISDVSVGVFLSGGLDSASVAASLARHGGKTAAFTVRFDEKKYDESGLAALAARRWGLDHHPVRLEPDYLFFRTAQAAWLSDEPILHASTPHLYTLSLYAKPRATVLLSGEGSDEIFGGYDRYHVLLHPGWIRAAKWAPARALRSFHYLNKAKRFSAMGSGRNQVYYNSCEIMPRELALFGVRDGSENPYRLKILEEAQSVYPGEPARQAMYYDQHTFLSSILDRNDRMTMGASIECRVPFLDSKIMSMAAALPTEVMFGKENKQLLRDACGSRLPEEILRHKKWGFGVPWAKYLRSFPAMRTRLHDLIRTEPLRTMLPADKQKIKSAVHGFLRGETRHEKLVYRLFMLSLWCEFSLQKFRHLSAEKIRSAHGRMANAGRLNTEPAEAVLGRLTDRD